VERNPGYINKNLFTFCNWNLGKGNFSRIGLIEANNLLYNYDLISLCETSLNDTVELPDNMLQDYTFISSNNPNNARSGGVGLFYRSSLSVKVRNDLSFSESIVIEINIGNKKIFFSVIYRSPANKVGSPKFDEFLNDFQRLYVNIKNEKPYTTYFVGDFNGHSNIWWPDGDTNPEGRGIEELTSSLGLIQLINEPTNMEPQKNFSCIDLIFTDQTNMIMESGVRPSLDKQCHHQITYCNTNFKIPNPPPYKRKLWHYDRAQILLIKRAITEFKWHEHLSTNMDPNWQVESFTKIVLQIISNFVPNEIKKIIPREPPWITKPLKTMLNKQHRLYKNFKRHGFKQADKLRVDAFREECQDAIKVEKEKHLNYLGSKLASKETSKKLYWKIINKIMNKCKAPKIPPIIFNNEIVTNFKDKANIFVNFFSNQCTPMTTTSTLPNLTFKTNERLYNINICNDEILSLIRNLNVAKASGPDGISSKMLQLCDESIVLPLSIIYNNIIKTGIFPNIWKLANVIPVHKKGDKQIINNYRPISLLPICGKIFEKIVFNQLYTYLVSNNLITKNQSGFRAGDSAINQLLEFTNTVHKSFDNRPSLEVRSVFLDISKAFDKVWHEGLLHKLMENGICGNSINLLTNYLRNRKQRVVLNGNYSEFQPILSGVPQGSVLGPLLFLVYINDLEKGIKSSVKFFADDTMLFSIVHDPNISANDLNHDLDLISQWAHQWKMAFNPDIKKQAVEVIFSSKTMKVDHPPLLFNGTIVSIVKEHKHLGMILDRKLSFSTHIYEKIKKTKKGIGLLKLFSSYLPLTALTQIYKLYIRLHLDYGDIIYHTPHKINEFNKSLYLSTQMESLENVQYNAALAVTGTWQGSSRNKLYTELGWESLSYRRWLRRLLLMFKIHSNMTPRYLKDNLPPVRQFLYGINNELNYREFFCNTQRYKNSFYPDAVKIWNGMDHIFKDSANILAFKKQLNALIRPEPKSIFRIFDPIGLKRIYQLRVGLSPLKYHKKKYNFLDTPHNICDCGNASEDVTHFFFHCSLHANVRFALINSISMIVLPYPNIILENNVNLLLYGHHKLNFNENRQILISTTKYIKESNRFAT